MWQDSKVAAVAELNVNNNGNSELNTNNSGLGCEGSVTMMGELRWVATCFFVCHSYVAFSEHSNKLKPLVDFHDIFGKYVQQGAITFRTGRNIPLQNIRRRRYVFFQTDLPINWTCYAGMPTSWSRWDLHLVIGESQIKLQSRRTTGRHKNTREKKRQMQWYAKDIEENARESQQ